ASALPWRRSRGKRARSPTNRWTACSSSTSPDHVTASPSPLLAEALIGVAEDHRAALDARGIVLLRGADPVDQERDAGGLAAAELAVLEINVVHDLGDGAQGRILEAEPLEQNLERAFVALMGELALEHVEPQLAGARLVFLRRDEFEFRLG